MINICHKYNKIYYSGIQENIYNWSLISVYNKIYFHKDLLVGKQTFHHTLRSAPVLYATMTSAAVHQKIMEQSNASGM